MDLIQVLAFESPSLDLDITVIIQTAIFLVVMLGLRKFVLVPYFRAYDQRESLTTGAQEEAHALQAQAVEAKQHYEEERQKTYAEVESLRKMQINQANAEAHKVIETRRAEVQADIARRQAELQSDLKAARQTVAPQVQILSKNIADKILV